MKTSLVLLFSHVVTAVVAGVAAVTAERLGGDQAWFSSGIVIAGFAILFPLFLSKRLIKALREIRTLVSKPGHVPELSTGFAEFDATLDSLGEHVSRWDEVAANARAHTRELQAVLSLLDRTHAVAEPNSMQLRGALTSLGNRLDRLFTQIEQNTVEIDRCTQQFASNAESQGNAVIKTSTYVEQLTTSLGAMCDEAELIQREIEQNGVAVAEALKLVRELGRGFGRIQAHSEASERKLRALEDPTRQISSIIETIADLAGRTDLLALNASIESIRAGEHGRGFAIVADEVRKLAEQAAQATREVAVLIDTLQLQTQESIAAMAQERSEFEAETCLVATSETMLEKLFQKSDGDRVRAKKIAASGLQQLQIAGEVVTAVEQISTLARSERGNADNAKWAMKSLAKTALDFDSAIDVLRDCGLPRRSESATTTSTVTV